MKLVSSHGRLSPLFMKKVMIWHFLSNIHQVMTESIVVLHSNCSEDFSAISSVCFVSAKNHYSTRLSSLGLESDQFSVQFQVIRLNAGIWQH
jgi:hypothetical protein